MTLWVGGVSSKGTISDRESKDTLPLDKEDDSYGFEIIRDGEEISIDMINEGSVVSAAIPVSQGSRYNIQVLVQDNFEEGVLTAYDITEGEAWINDKKFFISDAFIEKLSLGDEGAFYYDAFGELVARSEYKTVIYGYLYKMGEEKRNTVAAKIFTENNRWVTLELEEKICFNNDKKCKASDIFEKKELFTADGEKRILKPQLIAYRITPERKISMIETATEDLDSKIGEESVLEGENSFRLSKSIASQYYRQYSTSFETEVYFGGNTKIFMIPPDGTDFEDEIIVCSEGALVADRAYTNINVYNRNAYGVSSLITLDKDTKSYVNLDFMVISQIRRGTNAVTGEDCFCIKGWQKGNLIELSTKDLLVQTDSSDVSVTGLSAGDIVQFELDRDSSISKIYIKYNADGENNTIKSSYSYTSTAIYNSYNFISGTVLNASGVDKMFSIRYQGENIASFTTLYSEVAVYRFNQKEETLEKVSFADVASGKKVLIAMSYLRPNTIIVYD